MQTQYNVETLRQRIKEIEQQQVVEGQILKTQLAATYENLKPINIVKSIVGDVFESKSLREEFVNTTAGFVSGLITKKLIVGSSKSPALKLLGLGIQLGMTTLISKNYGALKELITQLAGSVFSKMQEDFLKVDEKTEND